MAYSNKHGSPEFKAVANRVIAISQHMQKRYARLFKSIDEKDDLAFPLLQIQEVEKVFRKRLVEKPKPQPGPSQPSEGPSASTEAEDLQVPPEIAQMAKMMSHANGQEFKDGKPVLK